MKRAISLVLSAVLMLSFSVSAFAETIVQEESPAPVSSSLVPEDSLSSSEEAASSSTPPQASSVAASSSEVPAPGSAPSTSGASSAAPEESQIQPAETTEPPAGSEASPEDSEMVPADEEEEEPDSERIFDAEAHDARTKEGAEDPEGAITPQWDQRVGNEYIEFAVDDYNGEYTIGTTGGNPNFASDNNKKLLFGHPSPWSSFTTIRIDGRNYKFDADRVAVDATAKQAVATMDINGVIVQQILKIIENDTTGLKDTVQISYNLSNQSGAAHVVGVRIMLDTMLGSNDGAPFKVPGVGDVTKELELRGANIPQYWQAFDNLTDPEIFAVGTFLVSGVERPSKVLFSAWPSVYSSSYMWDVQVNPARNVTNDSAVSVYWDTRSLAPSASMTVGTNYGVGYASGIGELVQGSAKVPKNGFGVKIVDSNGAPVAGAAVTAVGVSGAPTTDEEGVAVFELLPPRVSGKNETSISIQKAGYQSATVKRVVKRGGALIRIPLFPDDGGVYLRSALAEEQGTETDLVANCLYYAAKAQGDAAGVGHSIDLNLNIEASAGEAITKYEIIQGGKVVKESANGRFTFKVITGTAQAPQKYKKMLRIDELSAGKAVQVRVTSASGKKSKLQTIGIKVSAPRLENTLEAPDSVSIGSSLKIPVADNIPIIGGSELEFGFDKALPFEMEIFDDGKVKISINKEIKKTNGDKKNESAWDEAKNDYNDAVKKLSTGGYFNNKKVPIKAGVAKPEVEFMGYGEGFVDKFGNVSVSAGIVVSYKQKLLNNTWYTPTVLIVPIYFNLNSTVAVKGSLSGTCIINNRGVSFNGAQATLSPAIDLEANGGIGVRGFFSAEVGGKGTLQWDWQIFENNHKVSLTGQGHFRAQALLWKSEKVFAKGTWNIYDSNRRMMVPASLAGEEEDFALTPRAEAPAIMPMSGDTGSVVVEDYTFQNAMPQLVKVGAKYYLFWLRDVAARSLENRTALVYSSSTDLETWSPPKQLVQESAGSTADFNFSLRVEGSDIHVVWMKAAKQFTSGVTMEEMYGDTQIVYSKLSTATDVNTAFTNLSAASVQAKYHPATHSQGGVQYAAWAENDLQSADGLFGGDNQYSIRHTTTAGGNGETIPVDGMVVDVALGTLSGKPYLAYVLDADADGSTADDRSLYLLDILGSESEGTLLAGPGDIARPSFGKIAGADSLLWYKQGNVTYTSTANAATKASVLGADVAANLNDGYTLMAAAGKTQVVWSAVDPASDSGAVAFYAADFTGASWTAPYKLADTGSGYSMVPSGCAEAGRTVLAYLETPVAGNERATLRVTAPESAFDLALHGAGYSLTDMQAGEDYTLQLDVENQGGKAVTALDVLIDGVQQASFPAANLQPGERRTFEVSYPVTTHLSPADLAVQLQATGEANQTNNEAGCTVGYTDLGVQADIVMTEEQTGVNVIVTNSSPVPSGALLRIFAEDGNGAVLYEETMDEVEPFAAQSVLLNLPALVAGVSMETLYISVAATSEDYFEQDNTANVFVGTSIDETEIAQNKSALYVTATTGGIVQDVGGLYLPGTVVQLTATPNAGYYFAGWVSSDGGTFGNARQASTQFTMPGNATILTAKFTAEEYYVSYGSFRNGRVTASPRYAKPGQWVTVSVYPSSGYQLKPNTLKYNDTLITGNAFTMPHSDVSIRAEFERKPTISTPAAPAKPRAQATSVKFPQARVNLIAGKSITMPATAYTKTGEKATLSYTSSNTKVAKVTKSGKITAVKAGTVKITAKAQNGKKASLTVKVLKKGAKAVKVTSAKASVPKTMKVGATKFITGKYSPASATSVRVTYSSDKKSVVSVDKNGRLMAKKKGKAVITIKAGGKSKKYTVTVK